MQVIYIGAYFYSLSFESGNNHLFTDIGVLALHNTIPKPSLSPNTQPHPVTDPEIRAGISRDLCWITWNHQNLLWLPIEFRPLCSSVRGPTLAIGCISGAVIFSQLSDPQLATEQLTFEARKY